MKGCLKKNDAAKTQTSLWLLHRWAVTLSKWLLEIIVMRKSSPKNISCKKEKRGS